MWFCHGRNADVLSEVERRERQKMRGEMVSRIVQMDVKCLLLFEQTVNSFDFSVFVF